MDNSKGTLISSSTKKAKLLKALQIQGKICLAPLVSYFFPTLSNISSLNNRGFFLDICNKNQRQLKVLYKQTVYNFKKRSFPLGTSQT
ncbi:hypothetical protein Gasu2_67060 [Galdieria sulphuraria]|uniref:Uncharacterized protein n=1 Tax=Galdieria sulphuraria TaxID=130081 RepID=M2XKY0_GALSU|nr:uncharacterized protein Gasu_20250 [Galdieria sulphuraria]EME30792.1 hypothetical protein Gasu_20250 [Galdieria sulphuraria]GJD10869.1 hypothetical protein Gasu2_50340 [Galdieria sulphuraria]GJD12632.1 hypothetical protein Gasu2_67060 [Galdieria sulphuraria]|eukprot:XP_005707312.1 hypothetical protein Gasu_20250 [Galdieria sulphuraria]